MGNCHKTRLCQCLHNSHCHIVSIFGRYQSFFTGSNSNNSNNNNNNNNNSSNNNSNSSNSNHNNRNSSSSCFNHSNNNNNNNQNYTDFSGEIYYQTAGSGDSAATGGGGGGWGSNSGKKKKNNKNKKKTSLTIDGAGGGEENPFNPINNTTTTTTIIAPNRAPSSGTSVATCVQQPKLISQNYCDYHQFNFQQLQTTILQNRQRNRHQHQPRAVNPLPSTTSGTQAGAGTADEREETNSIGTANSATTATTTSAADQQSLRTFRHYHHYHPDNLVVTTTPLDPDCPVHQEAMTSHQHHQHHHLSSSSSSHCPQHSHQPRLSSSSTGHHQVALPPSNMALNSYDELYCGGSCGSVTILSSPTCSSSSPPPLSRNQLPPSFGGNGGGSNSSNNSQQSSSKRASSLRVLNKRFNNQQSPTPPTNAATSGHRSQHPQQPIGGSQTRLHSAPAVPPLLPPSLLLGPLHSMSNNLNSPSSGKPESSRERRARTASATGRNKRKNSHVRLNQLDDRCLLLIFDQLTLQERLHCERVCHRWQQLIRISLQAPASLKIGEHSVKCNCHCTAHYPSWDLPPSKRFSRDDAGYIIYPHSILCYLLTICSKLRCINFSHCYLDDQALQIIMAHSDTVECLHLYDIRLEEDTDDDQLNGKSGPGAGGTGGHEETISAAVSAFATEQLAVFGGFMRRLSTRKPSSSPNVVASVLAEANKNSNIFSSSSTLATGSGTKGGGGGGKNKKGGSKSSNKSHKSAGNSKSVSGNGNNNASKTCFSSSSSSLKLKHPAKQAAPSNTNQSNNNNNQQQQRRKTTGSGTTPQCDNRPNQSIQVYYNNNNNNNSSSNINNNKRESNISLVNSHSHHPNQAQSNATRMNYPTNSSNTPTPTTINEPTEFPKCTCITTNYNNSNNNNNNNPGDVNNERRVSKVIIGSSPTTAAVEQQPTSSSNNASPNSSNVGSRRATQRRREWSRHRSSYRTNLQKTNTTGTTASETSSLGTPTINYNNNQEMAPLPPSIGVMNGDTPTTMSTLTPITTAPTIGLEPLPLISSSGNAIRHRHLSPAISPNITSLLTESELRAQQQGHAHNHRHNHAHSNNNTSPSDIQDDDDDSSDDNDNESVSLLNSNTASNSNHQGYNSRQQHQQQHRASRAHRPSELVGHHGGHGSAMGDQQLNGSRISRLNDIQAFVEQEQRRRECRQTHLLQWKMFAKKLGSQVKSLSIGGLTSVDQIIVDTLLKYCVVLEEIRINNELDVLAYITIIKQTVKRISINCEHGIGLECVSLLAFRNYAEKVINLGRVDVPPELIDSVISTIGSNFCNLQSLHLRLHNFDIDVTTPANLLFDNLTELSLQFVSGNVDKPFKKFIQLGWQSVRSLSIQYASVTEESIRAIGENMPQLRKLVLYAIEFRCDHLARRYGHRICTNCSHAVWKGISSLPYLANLKLHRVIIDDEICKSLSRMSRLTVLDLQYCSNVNDNIVNVCTDLARRNPRRRFELAIVSRGFVSLKAPSDCKNLTIDVKVACR